MSGEERHTSSLNREQRTYGGHTHTSAEQYSGAGNYRRGKLSRGGNYMWEIVVETYRSLWFSIHNEGAGPRSRTLQICQRDIRSNLRMVRS
jgi:hypothetical protein